MRDATARRLSSLHTGVYRITGGRLGRRLVRNDMLLLTTVGRSSGEPHQVPLLYLAAPERRLVVFASWGGRPAHPDWYLNLCADPAASVQVERRSWDVTAATAEGDERAQWWQAARQAYQGYAVYEGRTERKIPVVFLDPVTR